MRASMNRSLDQYQFTVRPLSNEEGGGYLVEYPDIPGCMSDGETIEEAIANGREALRDCMEVFRESGRKVPKPSIEAAQWRQRLPKNPLLKANETSRKRGRQHQQSGDGNHRRGDRSKAGASLSGWLLNNWLPTLDTFRTFAT